MDVIFALGDVNDVAGSTTSVLVRKLRYQKVMMFVCLDFRNWRLVFRICHISIDSSLVPSSSERERTDTL